MTTVGRIPVLRRDVTTERGTMGGWRCTALVRDDATPFAWYESMLFLGYGERDAVQEFLRSLVNRNYWRAEED